MKVVLGPFQLGAMSSSVLITEDQTQSPTSFPTGGVFIIFWNKSSHFIYKPEDLIDM